MDNTTKVAEIFKAVSEISNDLLELSNDTVEIVGELENIEEIFPAFANKVRSIDGVEYAISLEVKVKKL